MIPLPFEPPTLKQRAQIELGCQNSEEFRQEVLKKCAEDPAWFINAFCWTFDPRPDAPQPHLPFILYPFQIDTIRWLDQRIANQEDGIIEKSRDMGVSWLILCWMVQKWLFEDGFISLVGSRKEDLVDNYTLDSMFGKIEYVLRRLPGWMMPKGFNFRTNRKKLRLINPETDAAILGESSNPNFGRQSRASVIVMDEGAFWPDLQSAFRSAGETARTRILNSTPNRMNYFYELRQSGRHPVLTLHWTLHPNKDEDWYEKQKSRMSPEDLAQEVDLSYTRSVRGLVYPTWKDVPKGFYPLPDDYVTYCSWDFGIGDDTAIVWWGYNPKTNKVRIVDCLSKSGKIISWFVPFILGYLPDGFSETDYTDDEMEQISRHSTWKRPIHFGDPAGNQRQQNTGTSVIEELRPYGIHINTNERSRSFRERKASTELGLRQVEGVDIEHCATLDLALLQARFPETNPDRERVSKVSLPVHDWTAHLRTAVEYFFVNLPLFKKRKRHEGKTHRMSYDDM